MISRIDEISPFLKPDIISRGFMAQGQTPPQWPYCWAAGPTSRADRLASLAAPIRVPWLVVNETAGVGVPFGVGVITTVWISLPPFTTTIHSFNRTAGARPVMFKFIVPVQSAFSE